MGELPKVKTPAVSEKQLLGLVVPAFALVIGFVLNWLAFFLGVVCASLFMLFGAKELLSLFKDKSVVVVGPKTSTKAA